MKARVLLGVGAQRLRSREVASAVLDAFVKDVNTKWTAGGCNQ
jgi:hypothetical protein